MRNLNLKKSLKIVSVCSIAAVIIVLFSIGVMRSQVQEIGGLAVAQSAIKWNYLKDASYGDNVSEGVGAFSLYLWDGTNFDRARGDIAYGLDVDVTRVSGNVSVIGNKTSADNYSNPTDAIVSYSLLGIFDGSTWDRALASVHGDNLTTSQGLNTASFNYFFDGTNWDRGLASVHGDNLTTSSGQNVASFSYGFDGTNWDRLRVSSAGSLKIDPEQSSSISTGQVSVSSTATQIVAAGARKSIIIKNIDATNDVFIGGSGVTTANGFKLSPNQEIELNKTTAAIYGIATASCNVAYIVQ